MKIVVAAGRMGVLLVAILLNTSCLGIFGSDRAPASSVGSFTSAAPYYGSSGSYSLDARFGFSAGYQAPASRQGVSEARREMSAADFDARYARLAAAGVRYRQYNVWWSELEPHASDNPSSSDPLTCPADTRLVPANEGERIALGYHRYRCISNDRLSAFDQLFTRDQAAGMQSGVVIWSSPAAYRNPGCAGFPFGGSHLYDGCIPRDSAMDDFEDYVNLLASRYNGASLGKISAFIVWNENASADWFDATPLVAHDDVSDAAIAIRLDRYAEMMKRAHAALGRHQRRALLLASTDQLWNPRLVHGHMGTATLLEGLWSRLGIDFSWSVAVHPYGDAAASPRAGIYTFANVEMVSDFQASHLLALGIADPSRYPQTLMLASEQGWAIGTNQDRTGQARQICIAHGKARRLPQLVAVAHNYFHSVEPSETDPNGSSGQGAFFGLVPYAIPNSLEGWESTSTGQAYLSTFDPGLWGQSSAHFCCQVHGLGCSGG